MSRQLIVDCSGNVYLKGEVVQVAFKNLAEMSDEKCRTFSTNRRL